MKFDNQWFKKNQRPLLAFVNTILGRWFFALANVDVPRSAKIMEVGPGHISYDWKIVVGEGGLRLQKKTAFFSAPRLQNRLSYVYACAKRFIGTGLAWKLAQPHAALGFLPLVALTTSTFYPDPDAESTSVDGYVRQDYGAAAGVAWTTIVNKSAGNTANSTAGDDSVIEIQADITSNTWRKLVRAFYLFDTAALPDGDTIDSATLSIKGSGKFDATGITPNVNIYASTPASNTDLVTDDFDQVGSTAFATAITYANWSTSAYNDFALNASGLAAITKTGVSKFSARNAAYDVADSQATWGATAEAGVQGFYADQTGTTSDPKLVVIHSAPIITKTVTDTLTLTTAAVKSLSRTISNTLTLTTATTAIRSAIKTVTDTLTLTSSIVRSITKVVSNTLTMTTSRVVSLSRTITNTLTLTTAATAARTAFLTVLDTLNLTAAVTKILNGAFTIWTALAKAAASWTNGSKNSSNWNNENKSS